MDEIGVWCADHRNYSRWFHSEKTKIAAHVKLFKCTPQGFFYEGPAGYLTEVQSNPIRTLLARFRTGSHNLEVETGRWAQVLRENRKCKCCNLDHVEDEMHFVFDCPLYSTIRDEFRKELFENNPRDMHILFTKEKVNATGQYLKQCFSLRDTHLGALTG